MLRGGGHKIISVEVELLLPGSILFPHCHFSPFVPVELGGTEAASSAQLLCATYRVRPIVMGKSVVVNTGLYSSRASLRDVSMAWKVSPKCKEL